MVPTARDRAQLRAVARAEPAGSGQRYRFQRFLELLSKILFPSRRRRIDSLIVYRRPSARDFGKGDIEDRRFGPWLVKGEQRHLPKPARGVTRSRSFPSLNSAQLRTVGGLCRAQLRASSRAESRRKSALLLKEGEGFLALEVEVVEVVLGLQLLHAVESELHLLGGLRLVTGVE